MKASQKAIVFEIILPTFIVALFGAIMTLTVYLIAGHNAEALLKNASEAEIIAASESSFSLMIVARMFAFDTVMFALAGCAFFYLLYRSRRKLEALLQREKDVASLISHQLRTPLTELQWMIDIVSDVNATKAERDQMLKDMKSVISGSVHTITMLLEFSRIERGIIDLKNETVDVAKLVRNTLLPLREAALQKNVTFDKDIAPRLFILADATKATEALRNVIDNAIKYGPIGQHVEIEARAGKLGFVRISVRDHGPGIPEEIQQKVYEKSSAFVRKGTGSGAGLGLYLTKELVEHMGGVVQFETGIYGTTFHIDLPIAPSNRKNGKK